MMSRALAALVFCLAVLLMICPASSALSPTAPQWTVPQNPYSPSLKAQEYEKGLLNDELAREAGKGPSPTVTVNLPNPPYATDNPSNRGTNTGPCPIGAGQAPQLRDTHLSSGALCRGACGIDCPAERCDAEPDINFSVGSGFCLYRNVIMCNSHKGCRDHDACYDYCTENLGETGMLGPCHSACNQRCFDEYGYSNCAAWADLPGSVVSSLGSLVDYSTAPMVDRYLYFSDEPDYYPTTSPVNNPTIAETVAEPSEPATDIASGSIQIPDLMQEKPKVQYTAQDFITAGANAASHGMTVLALENYNKAEETYLKNYPDKSSRPADVDSTLSGIEKSKASIYHSMPGHTQDEMTTLQNANDLEASANSKEIASDWLPGFEAIYAAIALGIGLIIIRKKL